MATKRKTKAEKHEELIQTLKFTPRTYTISIGGYGGETYAGVVDRKIYDYFKAKKIDIEQYAFNWDEDMWRDIPDEMRPFEPGSPHDCDNVFHGCGATFDGSNLITITDENGDIHWEQDAGFSLEDEGVKVSCLGDTEIGDLEPGTIVIWSGQGEKGGFFEGEIELREPFDPAKLTVYYESCDGWDIICGIEYNGEEIDGSNGYGTTGKWSESKWIIVGDTEEVYESESRDEDGEYGAESEEDEGLTAFQTLANTLAERWNDVDTKPEAKGTYECKFETGEWPVGNIRTAEWTGRSWKENGKKAPTILGWRELENDDS